MLPSDTVSQTLLSSPRCRAIAWLALFTTLASAGPAGAGDWPQWRYDTARSANCPEPLPDRLHPQWVRQLPAPRPAFAKYPRLGFDFAYEPVVLGQTMFVPSMVTDSLTALDTDTGAVKWVFYAGGPVRFAPVANQGRVYFVSDDGCLYCLDAAGGALLWKFQGTPPDCSDRLLLGNDRLISFYPARGGPVLAESRIYFAVGVFPFAGGCVHCLDAQTGKPLWSNADIDTIEKGMRDHAELTEGGLSPQGYLTLAGDKLFVPGGRMRAAILDARTGALAPYNPDWGGRQYLHKGSWYISCARDYYFTSGDLFTLAAGERMQVDPANDKELGEFREPVLDGNLAYYSTARQKPGGYRPVGVGYDAIEALDLTQTPEWTTVTESLSKNKVRTGIYKSAWRLEQPWKVHIKAGSRLYAGAKGVVGAVELPEAGGAPRVCWEEKIDGTPARMLAAGGKLFVVTREGAIQAFGPGNPKTEGIAKSNQDAQKNVEHGSRQDAGAALQSVRSLLKSCATREGYAVILGLPEAGLLEQLANQSKFQIIVVDPDEARARALRAQFDSVGLYGTRIAIHVGDLDDRFPLYMANLVLCTESAARRAPSGELVKLIYRLLRPYGGTACFAGRDARDQALAAAVRAANLPRAEFSNQGEWAQLKRVGPLPDAGTWTHPDADAGSSLVANDRRVKPPLGVLWFGGAADSLFPNWDFTHYRAPTPLAAGGRMFFQVVPDLHAIDAFTGRHLWTARLPGLEPVNSKSPKQFLPYATDGERIYIAIGAACLVLDAANGKKISEIPCPEPEGKWGALALVGDCLVGSTASGVACMDARSGLKKWSYKPQRRFAGCAAGGGKVFCAEAERDLKKNQGCVVALDLATGSRLWENPVPVQTFPSVSLRLACSEEGGVVVASSKRISAMRMSDGKPLWDIPAPAGDNQPMVHPQWLFTQGGTMHDLQGGTPVAEDLWKAKRRGCTRVIGSRDMVLIRNGDASYYDIAAGKTVFMRGIRVGCTNNLIVADGLLCAPNFSFGCTCNYPVATSLAFAPVADFK